MNDWALGDSQLVLASTLCFGGLVVLCFLIAMRRIWVSRREFGRLQADVKRLLEDVRRLSEDVRGLAAAEQRRFIKELNATKKEDGGPSMAA